MASAEHLLDILAAATRSRLHNKLATYFPYGHPYTLCPEGRLWVERCWRKWSNKPWQLDFHNAGANNRERGLLAANRSGKTVAGGAEMTYHLTGEYPDWWKGKRFDGPILAWAASPTNETLRDIIQKELIGGVSDDELGTGLIPRGKITEKPRVRQAGVSDVIDSVKVKHAKGGTSKILFKTYEQGWTKWQGTAPSVIWGDEQPNDNEAQRKIPSEARTRIITSNGILYWTMTPLLGETGLVTYLMSNPFVSFHSATWDDIAHFSDEDMENFASTYPDHEKQARVYGLPLLGEGRVFTQSEEQIKVSSFDIPAHFACIKGIDFGTGHPSAVAEIAWDRDKDIIYVTRTWRRKGISRGVTEHAEAINSHSPWMPVAWPHDGDNREPGGAEKLKKLYVEAGVKMLSFSARYSNDIGGTQPVEPIVQHIIERIDRGEFKVFSNCVEFFDEYRNLHRKDGKIVPIRDDVIKSVFYAVMMRRYAVASYIYGRQFAQPPPRSFVS